MPLILLVPMKLKWDLSGNVQVTFFFFKNVLFSSQKIGVSGLISAENLGLGLPEPVLYYALCCLIQWPEIFLCSS